MRARLIGLGVTGVALLVVGIGVDAGQTNKEAACSTSAGAPSVLGSPAGPSVQSCNDANVISAIGLALLVLGAIVVVTVLIIAIVRFVGKGDGPGLPPPGWYPLPGTDRTEYWDGASWVFRGRPGGPGAPPQS